MMEKIPQQENIKKPESPLDMMKFGRLMMVNFEGLAEYFDPKEKGNIVTTNVTQIRHARMIRSQGVDISPVLLKTALGEVNIDATLAEVEELLKKIKKNENK